MSHRIGFLFCVMVVVVLIHTNSAYPRRKNTKRRPAPPPVLLPRPKLSSSDFSKRLYLCRSQGQFPCFGQTLRCYPKEEICNGRPFCRYHDDELNCQNSKDRRGVRTFTIRITKTTGPTKTAVSTTTTTTTSTMTSASATSTFTSTVTNSITGSVTPTPNTPFSVVIVTSTTIIQQAVTTIIAAAGVVPGPGTMCTDLAIAAAAVPAPIPAGVHVLGRTNIAFSSSLTAVAVCSSTTVLA